ncbi:SUN domain-containing protein 1 isoform X2 [Xenopus laevis]|uniref:SUN domain-containing protein 1 isoform X2 n=1 Tax=Xenopus laevis TaxID=8355 RepID=A0A8J1M1L6_XENLA|nr:SUN domain-containing protein 1 isoform X2 [Xenopus laevis]
MDYSHLHTYAPPQCLPDNTGYTYALSFSISRPLIRKRESLRHHSCVFRSCLQTYQCVRQLLCELHVFTIWRRQTDVSCSSYSTEALDFETVHKLAPVFDSPRMSRRSLRLKTSTGNYADDILNDSALSQRSVRQQHNSSRQSLSSHHSASRRSITNASFQSSFNSQIADTSAVSSILDASLIREQTEVSSIWGLDDEELMKDGNTTLIQSNGDFNSAETQTTMINGYTCSDCSIVSQRNDTLTARSASYSASGNFHAASGSVHTACGNLHAGSAVTHAAASGTVHSGSANAHSASSSMHTSSTQVYSRDRSQKNRSTHLNYSGSVNESDYLKENALLRINGKSLCDDYKGTKHLEAHTTVHTQSSRGRGVTGTLCHALYYTGYLLLQAVRRVGAAGWFVSRKMLSFLWLAIVSPGRAASSLLWWLGTGWYQLTTLVSLLNVFILTRCLSKPSKWLLLLLPLLLLLGLYLWGSDYILLPAFGSIRLFPSDTVKETAASLEPSPESTISSPGIKEESLWYDTDRVKELEKQLGLMGRKHSDHMEDYKTMNVLVLKIQEQVQKMNDESHVSSIITNIFEQHFAKQTVGKKEPSVDSSNAISNHEARIVHLETLFEKVSQAIEEDRKLSESRTSGGEIHDQGLLRRRIESLEEEFEKYKAAFLNRQTAQTSCDLPDCLLQKVDARVKESVEMMFASQENIPESLVRWLSANFVNTGDFNSRLQEMELKILQNITHHVTLTKPIPSTKVVEAAVTGAIDGISKEETRVMINNALRLYSQDRTGMADFALESGGGGILGTRCSETYGTKTALMSLFGIPLWYFSQSPRVVIQPDMYPGNCWAFKGTQGFLVVRLSRMIYPTAFSIEHIPKSLSPLGNITSAPKDFAIYGLDDEYQEDGQVLLRAMYDQEGEPLQVFHIQEDCRKPFQIVELRIFSNWGQQDFTCLYRFRAHGTPAQ